MGCECGICDHATMSVFGIWLTVILLSVPSRGQSFFYSEPDNYHNRDSNNLQNRAAVERIPDIFDRYQTRNLVRDAVEKLPSKIGYLGEAKYRLSSGGNNVICHVDTTQYHKNQIPKKLEQTIQSSCTHVLLSSVDTNFDALANRWFISQSNGTFISVARLKKQNPSIKMLLYVNDIMPDSVSVTRRDFVISVNDLLKTHGFDGIVLSDVLPRSTNELYFDEDDTTKEEFPLLVEELASVLKTRGYLLGMVVSPVDHISRNYEASRLVPNLDLIILKSFDFRKYDNKVVGHHSPLYSSVDRDPSSKYHNVDYMVKYWLHKGAVPDQLVIGIALFGRSFKLEDPNYFQPGSRSAGNGHAGRWTKTPGYLSYYEVCERMKRNDWKQYSDSAGSPFLVRKDQWISYENPQSLIKKLEYVGNQRLGGVMLWSIDSDDFNGMCGLPWPLVNTVKTFTTHANNFPLKLRDVPMDSTLNKKVICYYASWSWYRVGDGKYAPEYINKNLCTHIVYAFAALDPNELIMIAGDEWEDVENKFYERFISKLKSGNTKIMISLGGWTDSYGDKYTKLVGSGVARKKFVTSAVAFLRKHNFDGLHLDWNYPVCWQADCTQGPPSDKSNFVKLTQELRAEFNKQDPPFELSASISGYDEIIKEAYDFPNLSENLDFMSVMTYDYHGPWENITGHVSPAYYKKDDQFPKYNMDSTIKLITRLGADPAKIVLGLPFYGQSYTLASSSEHGLGDPAKGPGIPGEYTQQPGMLAYYEICNRVYNENWQSSRDKQSGLDPYAYNGNQWVSYDDETSIRLKSEYIVKQNLGGAMVWTIDLDDFSNRCCRGAYPLLTKVNEVFQRISIKPSYSGCKKPDYPITPNVPLPTTTEEGEGSWEHQMEMMTTSTSTTTTTAEPIQVFTKPQSRPTTSTTTEPALWTTPSVTSTSIESTTETQQHQTHSPPANRPWWSEQSTKRPDQQQRPQSCVEGSYKPSKESCQNYYQCKNGRYRRHSCKKGLLWNRSANKCDLSENTNCNTLDSSQQSVQSPMTSEKPNRPSTSSQPTPTTTIRDTTCVEGEQIATTSDCISYFLCSRGQYIKELCPPGLAWNDQAKICDWKQNVNCENRRSDSGNLQRFVDNNGNELSTSGLVKIRNLPKPLFVYKQSFSECQDGQFAPHPGDCNKFLQCLWGNFKVNSCPSGLYWNAALNVCDWPYNSGCVQSEQVNLPIVGNYPTSSQVTQSRPTPKPITKPTTTRPTTITPSMESWWKPPSTTELATTENPWAWKPDSTTENSGLWKPEESNTGDPWEWKPTTTTGDPWEWKPTTTTAATLPTTESNYQLTEQYKVVCYFTNWAWYRPSAGKFFPEDTDPNLCTHIVYGFATLDYTELTIRVFDSWADIDNGFYERLVALKKRGVKVSIGLGGWNDSAGDKYSRMVNSRANRKKFINSIIKFIQKYGFQGLDVDWEYPKCWQTNCNQGPDSDKHSFSSLLIELRQAFRPYGYLLSAAVSPSKAVIDAGYDVPILSKYLDWIGVMTYDYHGQWDKKTGHVAPIYYHPEDEISYFNMNYTINYWIEKGANSRKIVLGIPLYGQSFTLSNPNVHGLNAPASGAGQAGQFTRSAGFLAYNEICIKLASGQWNIVRDPKKRIGPYAYSGNQWVGFDDIWSVKQKADYVKTMNLGGAMIWALDLDDFRNVCGQGHYPLLTTIMKTLGYKKGDTFTTSATNASSSLVTGSYPSYPQTVSPTEMVPTTRPPMRPTTTRPTTVRPIATKPPTTNKPTTVKPTSPLPTTIKPTTTKPTISTPARPIVNPSKPENFKVVCYFTNWAWYRQNGGRYLPSDVDPSLCTHIVYGFAVLDNEDLNIKAHDSWADYDNLFYQKVTELKKYGIKVLLAIGGWNDSAGSKYSELVNNPNARSKFVRHVVGFIKQNNFDGLDVDWEYPKCWQVDCKRGPNSDKEGFSNLLTELREAFDKEGFLLSAAVSPNKAVIDAGYDVPLLSRTLDWISVMAYDYHGQWDKKTGHVAPMYSHPDDTDMKFNANYTLYYWVSKGADPRKLVMGMPTYGQSFSLASSKENGLNALTYGGGEAGEATRSRGFMAYYEICYRILKKNWRIVQDPLGTMGPYAYNGNQWVSFDDQEMIKYKSEFVVRNNLGGAMIWALDLDDFRNVCGCETYPLLKTINRVLGRLPGPSPDCYLDLNENDIDGRESLDNKSDEKIEKSNKNPSCTEPLLRGFPEDCNKYEICQFGELSVQSCPESLYFNKKNALCDWPENVNCTKQLLSS
ncbi:probable chitinase 10 [Adelges cooleyi]|uniref:probable chitinase 10 n=1 Tax=Adelges cooleyi TaxID=133065 RepID=UPI00217F7A2E|nr:probable chitinase 10 [Adelges cooleyi]